METRFQTAFINVLTPYRQQIVNNQLFIKTKGGDTSYMFIYS